MEIFLAIDGSEHSLAGARLIHDLPLPANSNVTLLGVLTPRQSPGRAALLQASDKAKRILEGSGAETKSGLLHGHPAEALTDFADTHPHDLMIVGAQGRHSRLGILLGGAAQQVVEKARGPVLIVRAPYNGLRRVLLTTDGSPNSRQALEFLSRFPLPADAEVQVMHVLPPLSEPRLLGMSERFPTRFPGAGVSPEFSSQVAQAVAQQAMHEERAAYAILDPAVEALKHAGIEASSVLVRGDTATQIIDYVKAHTIDLVVAGSRGLGAVKGWLLGSVSRRLVHEAGCSVLIVREGLEAGGGDVELHA
jgi:nucleotide-binding universal stress UspA family protein